MGGLCAPGQRRLPGFCASTSILHNSVCSVQILYLRFFQHLCTEAVPQRYARYPLSRKQYERWSVFQCPCLDMHSGIQRQACSRHIACPNNGLPVVNEKGHTFLVEVERTEHVLGKPSRPVSIHHPRYQFSKSCPQKMGPGIESVFRRGGCTAFSR